MRLNDIRERAKGMGLSDLAKFRKGDLIRTIQHAEGNYACFGSPGRFDCPQLGCCWREDCLTSNPG